MNKSDATQIAKVISDDQMNELLYNAQNGIRDWSVRSITNKSLSKGAAWNILTNIHPTRRTDLLHKTRLIREFGEFLPKSIIVKHKKNKLSKVIHQEPIFK